MLNRLCSYLVMLVLLPLLAGSFLDAKGCDELDVSIKVETSELTSSCPGAKSPTGHYPSDTDCHRCCNVTCVKVITLNRVSLLQPAFEKLDVSYFYSFSHKSVSLSTPQKPPRA